MQYAMSYLRHPRAQTDSLSIWLVSIKTRRGVQIVALAPANKLVPHQFGHALSTGGCFHSGEHKAAHQPAFI